MAQPLREAVWQFPKNISMQLPYYPAWLYSLSIYARDIKTYVHIKAYMWMFYSCLLEIKNQEMDIPFNR